MAQAQANLPQSRMSIYRGDRKKENFKLRLHPRVPTEAVLACVLSLLVAVAVLARFAPSFLLAFLLALVFIGLRWSVALCGSGAQTLPRFSARTRGRTF